MWKNLIGYCIYGVNGLIYTWWISVCSDWFGWEMTNT